MYSTAAYKYLDIISRYSQLDIKVAMCLAEGAGGLARLFLDGPNSIDVFYFSLVDSADFAAHRHHTSRLLK